jgi:hypothetical protein
VSAFTPEQQAEIGRLISGTFGDLGTLIRQLQGPVAEFQGRVRFGEGDPEGTVEAPVATLFLRTDGGAASTLYVKESGTGNTGWQAK